jgi:hypothetical protein
MRLCSYLSAVPTQHKVKAITSAVEVESKEPSDELDSEWRKRGNQ